MPTICRQRILDIYMLYFFILPSNMRFLGVFFQRRGNPLVEFVIAIIFAIPVIAICLVISNTLRLSPILSRFLFGVIKK